MGLAHLIAQGFRTLANQAGTSREPSPFANILPGGIYYGARAEQDEETYPLALLQIQENDREYNSGGGSVVTYEVMLTVFSQAGQEYPAEIVRLFAAYFHAYYMAWDAIPASLGRILSMLPQGGTMDEDPDDEFGQDTERASITWNVTLSERETVFA